MKTQLTLTLALTTALVIGCGTKSASFSILPEEAIFKQSVDYAPRKIDILWVVDNSGSMATSQSNVAANFRSFIQRIEALNYDFHIGVIGTDAYKTIYNSTSTLSNLRDGGATKSGVFVLDKDTPNLENTFITNVTLGVSGTGDERAFQSIKAGLNDADNIAFRRDDAFLAIIILSDEDDFSHNTSSSCSGNYNCSDSLHTVQTYVDFLDQKTNYVAGTPRNYSVSAITILDNACATTLNSDGWARYIGKRYVEIVEATGGTKGSLCGDFGSTLELISDSILAASSVFQLDREPIVGTIDVSVDGRVIPENSTNGWTYNAVNNTIEFHGNEIPPAGSTISIDYDPTTVKI